MSPRALVYLVFTAMLAIVFAGIVAFYYGRKRFERVERPKYRMLEDDDNLSGEPGSEQGEKPMDEPFKELEQHNRVPRGFLVLMFALIAWGLYYLAAYTPQFSGWSQYKVLSRDMQADKARAAAATEKMLENPYEHDAKAVAEGKTLYAEKCADCHGAELKGGDGPPLTGHLKYGEQDSQKYESIAKGRPGGMPPFGTELGRDRIWKVLAYVDSVREYGKKP
ncbi:MAG: c-type cytochrome [Verrucomicrobiota bacterium]